MYIEIDEAKDIDRLSKLFGGHLTWQSGRKKDDHPVITVDGMKQGSKMTKFELVSKYKGEKNLIPKRETAFSAGYDFKSVEDTIISAGKITPTLVSTGVKAKLAPNQVLILANRSSNALKRLLIVPNGIGVIDADYYDNPDNEGEIFGMFINLGEKDYKINKGDRIMQGIITKFDTVDDDCAQDKRIGGIG